MLADNLAPFANPVFAAAERGMHVSLIEAWGGALAYTLQIYFDFSGYSDMAIGLARMFGIRLPINFDSPYKATSIIDFWRRWHITLSRFLRDYLYIPLGGNRRGRGRRYVNLMATMLLGGLWHGAAWTFVLWGGLHGLYLVANHGWRAARRGFLPVARRDPWERVAGWAGRIAVVFAWVFFRAGSFDGASDLLAGMFGFHGLLVPARYADRLGALLPALQHAGVLRAGEIPPVRRRTRFVAGTGAPVRGGVGDAQHHRADAPLPPDRDRVRERPRGRGRRLRLTSAWGRPRARWLTSRRRRSPDAVERIPLLPVLRRRCGDRRNSQRASPVASRCARRRRRSS